jgi:uncharacterized membrane protein
MDDQNQHRSFELDSSRLEAFSDAVMAVIITIMAFNLRPPQGTSLDAIRHQLPGLFVYVLSFTFIAIYWNNHHHLLKATERINGTVMWANTLLLLWLSLIPVLTQWMRDYYRYSLPAAAYGVAALGAGGAFSLLVHAIIRVNGRDSAVAKAVASDFKGNISLVIYAAAVGLAFVSPWIAYVLYAAVAVMWIVPDRRFTSAR